jgi:positive regulator of sigma E activity
MTAEAVVVAARANGRIDLEFTPARQCPGCAGTCLWKRLQSTRLEQLAAGPELKPGTEVTVALPERRVLMTSMLLHGIPLVSILFGAAAGAAVAGSDAGTLIGALLALAVTLPGVKPLGRRLEQTTLAHLVITPKS